MQILLVLFGSTLASNLHAWTILPMSIIEKWSFTTSTTMAEVTTSTHVATSIGSCLASRETYGAWCKTRRKRGSKKQKSWCCHISKSLPGTPAKDVFVSGGILGQEDPTWFRFKHIHPPLSQLPILLFFGIMTTSRMILLLILVLRVQLDHY